MDNEKTPFNPEILPPVENTGEVLHNSSETEENKPIEEIVELPQINISVVPDNIKRENPYNNPLASNNPEVVSNNFQRLVRRALDRNDINGTTASQITEMLQDLKKQN